MAKSVSAGQAIIQFSANDSMLQAAVKRVQARLQSFGRSVRNVGLVASGAGAAITAPLALSAKSFAAYGDKLDKMRARTGIGAQALSEIGYAAEISGASLEQMEKATAGMSRQLFAAQNGSAMAQRAFAMMGISLDDIRNMSQEDIFTRLVDGLGNVENESDRAGVAMTIFGKSGRYLLNMSGEMGKLRQEARDLGVTMSDGSSKVAADLTDALTRLKYLKDAIINQMGEAVAPMIIRAVDAIRKYSRYVIEFVGQHKKLIAGIAAGGVALMAFGAALVALGVTASAVAAGLGVIATGISALFSPVVLIAGALALGVAAFVNYTETGQRALSGLRSRFATLSAFVMKIVDEIRTALAAGGIGAAADLMWGYIKIAFLNGKIYVLQIWADIKTATVNTFQELWHQVKEIAIRTGIAEPIVEAFNTIQTAWGGMVNKMLEMWNKLQVGVAKSQGWLAENIFQEFWGFVYGQTREEIELAKGMTREVYNAKISGLDNEMAAIEASGKKRLENIEAENKARLEALKVEQGKTPQQRRAEADAAKDKVAKGYADELAEVRKELEAATLAQEALIEAQKKRAAELAAQQDEALATQRKKQEEYQTKTTQQSAGTLSGYGAARLGQQVSYQNKVIDLLRKLERVAGQIANNTEDANEGELI